MRVHVQPDPLRDRVDVFVNTGGAYWLVYGEDKPQLVPQDVTPPVYVSLPTWIARELKGQLEGKPDPAGDRHLTDAIGVRDRLLTMVETQWSKNR